jgi:superfamily II RNA helicase
VQRKWIDLGRIHHLCRTVLEIGGDIPPKQAVRRIRQAAEEYHEALPPEEFPQTEANRSLKELEERLADIQRQLNAYPCLDCRHKPECLLDPESPTAKMVERLKHLQEAGPAAGRLLWSSFLKHFQFLVSEGFVSEEGELTADGYWAARLRLDHPLLIASGIKASAWPEDDPALLAAMAAPFVVDKETLHDKETPRPAPRLSQAWRRLDEALSPIMDRLTKTGFDTPTLDLRSAQAILHWAENDQFEEAVELYGRDPGDMAMLVFRTADNLRQMAGLEDTHPRLAPTARAAVDLILKEPVTIPL